MNPQAKVTWPELVAEFTIFWRSRLIKSYPKITKGENWSNIVAGQFRRLIQQIYTICNFFPHPDDEPLVYVAFRKYWRHNRVTSVGSYRKCRTKINDKGNEVLNVSKEERETIRGINFELQRLISERDAKKHSVEDFEKGDQDNKDVTYSKRPAQKRGVGSLLSLEDSMKDNKDGKE